MQEMGKAHMPDSLLKDYKEEKLLEISQSINQMDAGGLVAALDKKAVEYLIRDQGFLPYLMRLAQEESYDVLRVSRLLIEAKDVPLSESYPYEQIASVLADGQIEAGRTYTCLKYFMSEPLTEEEKDDLMVGLSVLDGCAGFSIDDLTDKERRLLAEPVISSGFLGKMVQERGFIKRLICPGYGALIKRLSENAGRFYNPSPPCREHWDWLTRPPIWDAGTRQWEQFPIARRYGSLCMSRRPGDYRHPA